MNDIDKVILKLNEVINIPNGVERRDCYNISQTKGPYGFSVAVVFSHRDDPNDTFVIGFVVDDVVTRVLWNNDGWEMWSSDETFIHDDLT